MGERTHSRRSKMAKTQTPVVKDIQNGVARPKPGTKTGRIWEIADELSAQLGHPVPRRKVLEAAINEGMNPATAATQYGRWRKYHGLGAETEVTETAEAENDVSVEDEE